MKRYFTLIVFAIAVVETALAQDVAPTPLREWDFNNVEFPFGTYADQNSLISSEMAKQDWDKVFIDAQIEEAYWNANDELVYETKNVTLPHAFSKHQIVDHQIMGGFYYYLNNDQFVFGDRMNNIKFNAPVGAFGFVMKQQQAPKVLMFKQDT